MYKSGIFVAVAVAAVASASPLAARQGNDTTVPAFPITLGQLGYTHGHEIVAWAPTKTTMNDVCGNQASRTVIQTLNSGFPSNPLCDFSFTLEGKSSMSLMCTSNSTATEAQVTAIATNGEKSHTCVGLPINELSASCGAGSSLWQAYACQ